MPNLEQPNTVESKESIETDSELYPLVNEQLMGRYNRIATKWDSDTYNNIRRDDLLPKLLSIADIQDGHRVLEAMCGTALPAQHIKKTHPEAKVCGLDFSVGMLNQIPENILKVQASILGMPFDRTFDRVLLRTAIFDLPKRMQKNALAEIARVMKDDALFILQTYITEESAQKTLNEITNMKDRLAGQYQDMGKESPRYFATHQEFLKWFEDVGFGGQVIESFVSDITYQKTDEMSEPAKQQFSFFLESLAQDLKEAISLRVNEDGNYAYQLPGVIYKLRKKS